MDIQTLATILLWLYSGGGASSLTYQLMERWGWLATLQPELKRYASWVLTCLLVAAGFCLAVWFGYEPTPETGQHWAEVLVPMMLLAITAAQGIHGRMRLSKKAKALQ